MKTAASLFLSLLFSLSLFAQNNGSLYSATSSNLFLFGDLRARNVNDLVTIMVVENTTATSSANTTTQKKGDATANIPGFLGIKTPANPLSINSALDFAGQGATTRTGQLTASLAARVIQVLPNGNMVIEGTKTVTVNKEHQVLSVRGMVRPYDITAGNVVLSTVIANLEVNLDGKGIVSDANKPALFSKIFKYILPF